MPSMVHFVFVSYKSRNITSVDASGDERLAALGIEPMNARSIVLSALLGTHPPTLPARALVALAELFGVRAGTTRTSLSRMVANGELTTDRGAYGLAGRLLERQREQDDGRVRSDNEWNGDWMTVVAASDRRSMAERRAFRQAMVGARLAELRPDIWMRPANMPPQQLPGVLTTVGTLDCDDEGELIARLWPLDELNERALRLDEALTAQRATVERADVSELPRSFMVSAAVVRFLRTEPQLPDRLTPPGWAANTLRSHYDDFNRAFLGQLRAFFSSVA